jgi:folate-dependent phosphoribosylglycinamide formyltransferase PurN
VSGVSGVSGVAMVAIDSPGTWMVFNALDRAVGVDRVVVEEQISPRVLLAARARRLGRLAVAGQVLFRALAMPVIERLSRARTRAILAAAGVDATPAPPSRVTRVPSVNDPRTAALLRELAPRVVVVGGTRIISDSVLNAVPATFLNMHAGITPRYRGVHGGYWALACGDREHCGVTVHVVDPGVDTGDIVTQALIEPTPRDSFATYPYLQLEAGLPLLLDAVHAALEGRLEAAPAEGPSRQWYHPTLWGYLWTWLRRGVR